MRILVTGGAGFIGSAAVRRAVRDGHTVLNLDKLTYAGRQEAVAEVALDPAYAFGQIDITDAAALRTAVLSFDPDAILHLAAETHVDRSIVDADPFIETNVRGMQRLLDATLRHWQRLQGERRQQFRLIAVSTDEVYGSLDQGSVFTEASPYRPNSPYAASKAAADHLARAWHVTYDLPVIVTHCSNNYGPWQHQEKLIPTIVRHALAGMPIPIYGRGDQARDWLHVDDHVAGLFAALAKGRPGAHYNFGSPTPVANLDLAHRVCRLLDAARPLPTGRPYEDLISFVADRPGHDQRYAIDPTRAANELGWQPRRPLAEGLAETVAWLIQRTDAAGRSERAASSRALPPGT